MVMKAFSPFCLPFTFLNTACKAGSFLKKLTLLIVSLVSMFAGQKAYATSFTFSGTGNWNDVARWSPSYPGENIVSGHTVTIGGDCTINVAVSSASNVTVNISGKLTIDASLTTTGNLQMQTANAFTINGTLTVDGTCICNNGSIINISNTGQLTHSGTSFNCYGLMTNDGGIAVEAGATLSMIDGGLNVALIHNGTSLSISGTLTIPSTNQGAPVTINADKTLTINSGGAFIHNSEMPVSISGTLTNNGTLTVGAARIINCTATGTITNNGTITGTGTITSASGAFENPASGMISPGTSSGCFAFGNTGFTNAGTIAIEVNNIIACTSYDRINVTGAVSLSDGSTLNATINVANPANGQLITFITGITTLSGTFTNMSPALPSGWSVVYDNPTAGDVSLLFTVLPVELVSFQATVQDDKSTLLAWHTASERNNEGFEVERSMDGAIWVMLDFVPGNGTTQSEQSYSFIDDRPLPGANFYRLRQQDFDGRFEHSSIVSVDNQRFQSTGIQIYPNPAGDVLNLVFDKDLEAVLINIVDFSGRTVRSILLEKGQNVLPIADLVNGVYVVSLISNGKTLTERFVVSR